MYLKLDKKLILEIEEIAFTSKESQVESSADDIQKNVSKFQDILKFFKRIDIESLKIKDNQFTIVLNEEHLYLDNKFINVSADIQIAGSKVDLNIYSVYLKDIDLTFIGKSKIDISKRVVNFFGSYVYKYVEGNVNAQLNEKLFDFYVSTTKSIPSIKFLKELFRLDEIAEAWMYDNVTGDMNLNYLYGTIDLVKKEPIMSSIKGQAVITDAKIRFHKDVQTVDTKKLTIDYEDDTLSFDLKKPVYNKSKIYGSKVYIPNLTSLEKGVVFVDLKTKSMLNSDILEILEAYDIKLPLRQKSGKLDSSLVLKIPYLPSKKMSVDGLFKANNAVLKLNNFEFLAKKADVILKDSDVIIKNSHVIHKDMLDANLDLTINTKTSKAEGKAKINSFKINSEGESIVNIKGLNTKLDIDFNDSTKIDLKALDTKLDIKEEYIEVDIKELSKIDKYSKLLQTTGIKDGKLKVYIIDENSIDFDIDAKGLDFPFRKNGKKITKLNAKGKIRGDNVTIKTDNSDIEIILKKNENTLLKLRNIDLVLDESEGNNNKSEEFPNIDIKLKNSNIILDKEHKYETSWANIHIKNSKIFFEGEALNLDLPISKNGKKVKNLKLYGSYKNKTLDIKTEDEKLKLRYEVPKEKISMKLDAYDVLYDTDQETDEKSKVSYYIDGVNSNIIINKKYIAKATSYNFVFEDYKTDINLKHNKTTFIYHKDFSGHITVDAKNMDDEFLNALMNKNLIKDGNVDLSAIGKDGKINGSAFLKENKIKDLAILNNLLILIHTSPALINPLLAIPSVVGMATNKGFNLNGYSVVEGKIDFSYDFKNKFLDMHKIKTKGNGIDFDGFTTIDFNNQAVNAKLKLVFFKNYSKIVGAIPVINYVLLGDEKRVDTEVIIDGTIDKPKYKTKLVEEGVSAPVNVIKRIITSPAKIIETIGKGFKSQSQEKKSDMNTQEEHDELLNSEGDE